MNRFIRAVTTRLAFIITRVHTPEFRQRFASEMVSVYEQRMAERSGSALLVYSLVALPRMLVEAIAERIRGAVSGSTGSGRNLLLLRRGLLRRPGYLTTAVLTLGAGVAATASVVTVVDVVLLRDLPYPSPERLVQIGSRVPDLDILGTISVPTLSDLTERSRTLTDIAAIRSMSADILSPGTPVRVNGASASASLFRMLGARVVAGGLFDTEHDGVDAAPEAVVSSYLARRLWAGASDAVGGTLNVNGTQYTVIGVLSDDFVSPEAVTAEIDVWVPRMYAIMDRPWERRGYNTFRVVAAMAPGVALDEVEAELSAIASSLNLEFGSEVAVRGQPFEFRVEGLQEQTIGTARQTLVPLLAAVLLFLAVAVANIVNLMLARVWDRAREFSILTAIGATRKTLIIQVLGEACCIAILGGALGLVAASWALSTFGALIPPDLPRTGELVVDGRIVLVALDISLAAGAVASIAPALAAAGMDPARAIGTRMETGDRSGTRLRSMLVALQTALSMVLVTGAFLLGATVRKLSSVEPGFSTAGTGYLTIYLGPAFYADAADDRGTTLRRELTESVGALPNIVSVATSIGLPLDGTAVGKGINLLAEGREDDPIEVGSINWVGRSYFRTLGVGLLPGSTEFTDSDFVAGAESAIINQRLAEEAWPGDNAIGKRINAGPFGWVTVIGVANDVKTTTLDEPSLNTLYLPDRTSLLGPPLYLTVNAAVPFEQVAASVRETVQNVAPSLPLGTTESMSARVRRSISEPRFYSLATVFFSLAGLVLAAMGLYGTLSYAVGRSRSEIGIRMALGATARTVLRGVLLQGLKPVSIGIAVGALLTAGLTRAIRGMLFEVEPGDPVLTATAAAVMVLVATGAAMIPGLRAARVDPADALRVD